MANDDVEISSSGLRFSYLRFLADGAAGLFLVLLLLLAFYLEWPIPGLEHSQSFRSIIGGRVSHEAKIFVMILLVVLAVPIGLMINGFGWLAFGWVQTHTAGLWLHCRRLTASTLRLWHLDVLESAFGPLESGNLYRKGQFYEELLMSFDSAPVMRLYPVAGLKRLLRSASVICLLCSLYAVLVRRPGWMTIALLAGVLFLFGLSLLELYYDLGILFSAYIISLEKCVGGVSDNEQIVLGCLLQEKRNVRDRQLAGMTNAR